MKLKCIYTIIVLQLAWLLASPLFAAVKTIYIKPFTMIEGFKRTDPVGNLVKDYVSEYIIENFKNKYAIISDDEVRQVLAHEELRMTLDACYDDACMKQLMKSIKTDYMIYGTVSFTAGKHIITIKMLDRSGGDVRVGRVKTLDFKNRLKLKMASKDLAAYVISGKEIDMENYIEADEKELLKRAMAAAPHGLSFAYRFFMPLTNPVKTYFKFHHGGALEYSGAFGKYAAIFGGGEFVYGTGKSDTQLLITIFGRGYKNSSRMTSLFNSYYIGGRFGYPVSPNFYPYIGVAAKGTWYRHTYGGTVKNHFGVGADGSAGFAFTIKEVVAFFIEFRAGWGMVFDKNKTDISGMGCSVGLTAIF
jgi:hypothetical protein